MKKILTIAALTLIISGCSTTSTNTINKDAKITKVHKFVKENSLQLSEQSFTESQGLDKVMNSSGAKLPKHLQGEKIIITWKYKSKTPLKDAKLIFRYKTAEEKNLKTVEKIYPEIKKGTYKFEMDNTGSLFEKQGTMALWKITIEHEGKVIASRESNLWEEIKPWKEKAFN